MAIRDLVRELIAIQALSVVYCLLSYGQEAQVLPLMQRYLPPRSRESRRFHRFGGGMTCVLILMPGVFAPSLYHFASAALLAGAWYWLLFDPLAALKLGKEWWYLGEEAALDRAWRWVFGKKAGAGKVLVLAAAIAAGNYFAGQL